MAKLLVFGFDIAEASQIRRIRSLIAAGHEVRSAAMRRRNMNVNFEPEWPNFHLYYVDNQNFIRRLTTIFLAIAKMTGRRDLIAQADCIIARNFDMLAIAWAARFLSGAHGTPLVYECLDIHGLFTRSDLTGSFMRWCERRLLKRIDLLIVSSPGFLRSYFHPTQKYAGKAALVENKLWFDAAPVPRPAAPRRGPPDGPLVLGWVGSLRCAESFRLLLAAADAMQDTLRIRLHGNVHRHAIPDFDGEVGARDNIDYFGSYDYPDALKSVYGACDLVWAQDLWQRGANSDWLLPNRIYEASWFGCPSIAVADTETGKRVAEDGLGFVIPAPQADAIIDLLRRLDAEKITACARAILARPDRDFRLTVADVDEMLRPVLAGRSAAGKV